MTKHTHLLREIAKFAAGLVMGDLLMGVWMLTSGLLPQNIWGMWVTPQAAYWGIGFDAFLILVLIHYAWHPRMMEPEGSPKMLFWVVGVITGLVAIAHFLRLVFDWSVVIGSWAAPLWISWIAVFVAAFISYMSFHLATRK